MRAAEWLGRKVELNRAIAIGAGLFVGVLLATIIYVGRTEAQHAAGQREHLFRNDQQLVATDHRLRGAIARLERLEHPPPRDLRRTLDRILRILTPAQARRLQKLGGSTPGPGSPTPAPGTRSPGPAGGHRRSSGPPAGTAPPATVRPGGGAAPMPVPTAPPRPRPRPRPGQPPRPGQVIDLPPIDLDGQGPLEPIDPPPVRIPSVPPGT